MNRAIQLFAILIIFVMISCNNKKNDNENNDNEAILNTPNDIEVVKDLTIKWNDCLVKQDFQTLTTLYAERVSLYGKSISKEQAVSNKKDFFKIYPDFNQSITGDIMVVKVTDYQYKVSFPKRSSFKGNTSDVQGYLLFDKVADVWKITNESDDVTDKNISKPGVVEKGEEKKCIDVVYEIMDTSPKFIEKTQGLYEAVVRNGGTSWGIRVEGSPYPDRDEAQEYSRTYNFAVHESYPDRIVTIARFTFDPISRQLYELDIVQNELNPIDFDRKLLSKFDEACR